MLYEFLSACVLSDVLFTVGWSMIRCILTGNACLFQGDHVWLEPKTKTEFSVAIGAQVQLSDHGRIRVIDDDGTDHWIDGQQQIKHMNASSVHHIEDMILLGDLNEAGILRNLFLRYRENQIYVS